MLSVQLRSKQISGIGRVCFIILPIAIIILAYHVTRKDSKYISVLMNCKKNKKFGVKLKKLFLNELKEIIVVWSMALINFK